MVQIHPDPPNFGNLAFSGLVVCSCTLPKPGKATLLKILFCLNDNGFIKQSRNTINIRIYFKIRRESFYIYFIVRNEISSSLTNWIYLKANCPDIYCFNSDKYAISL